MPVNKVLEATPPTPPMPKPRALIVRWGTLHAMRTALGVAAVLVYPWAMF